MAFFGTFDFNEELFGGGEGGAPVFDPAVARVPWLLQEADGVDVYEFAVNPLSADMPTKHKTVTKEKTAIGNPIVYQGRDSVSTMSFAGTILTQEHYEIMREWFLKETQVSITDDLGRKYWVYITNFSPTRNYHHSFPWRHDYRVEATVLSW